MKPFRFIHAADLHLDTPFHGIGRVAPAVADVLQRASLDAWDALVRFTIEQEAAFLLLAGDIYDGAQRGLRAQLRFRRGLEQLAERDIETFIVHGNHDPLDGWSAIRTWPPGVTVFGSTSVQSVAVVRAGITLATVHGISYAKRDTTENLALGFNRTPADGLHIGLLHCHVGENTEHARYSACSVDDLVRAKLDYWALGHVHRSQLLSDADPLIVYPGCLQGRSTHPAERGPKGALVIEADEVGIQAIHFEPLDQVRFLDFELDVGTVDDVPGLQRALTSEASELRKANDGRGLVLRAHLTGRGEVHRDLLRQDVRPGLVAELRREADGNRPFLWWSGIEDHSRLVRDLDGVRARGDFSSELLRLSDLLGEDSERRDQWLFDELEPLRRGSLQRWLGGASSADPAEMIQRARSLALDILEDGLDR